MREAALLGRGSESRASQCELREMVTESVEGALADAMLDPGGRPAGLAATQAGGGALRMAAKGDERERKQGEEDGA